MALMLFDDDLLFAYHGPADRAPEMGSSLHGRVCLQICLRRTMDVLIRSISLYVATRPEWQNSRCRLRARSGFSQREPPIPMPPEWYAPAPVHPPHLGGAGRPQ